MNWISLYLDVKWNSVKRIYKGEGELLEFVIILWIGVGNCPVCE